MKTAASYYNLGLLYDDIGKRKEAEKYYLNSLRIIEKVI